ncbi:MAG TPA: NRDE family protein [Thermoanaerobaculia bacterium]|nr:NRDE family protein [Thermoanaerobaculia bacterium]
MCTASWLIGPDGYHLLFNRDELRTRPIALPPRRGERNGMRYLAPVDPQGGGTWIAANEAGLCLFLLNRRPDRPPREPQASRGLIPLELIDASEVEEVARRAAALDFSRHRPFTLGAIAPGTPPVVFAWTGDALESATASPPLVSSSVGDESLFAERRATYPSGPLTLRKLLAYQRSHGSGKSAASVCMHREDAQTVSFSRVRVNGRQVRLGYAPGSPCERAPMRWLALARTAEGAR